MTPEPTPNSRPATGQEESADADDQAASSSTDESSADSSDRSKNDGDQQGWWSQPPR